MNYRIKTSARAAVATLAVFGAFLSSPQNIFAATPEHEAFAAKILARAQAQDLAGLFESVDEIKMLLDRADDPILEAREILTECVNQANTQYQTDFTLSEVFALVRQNIFIFNFPPEQRQAVLLAIDLIEAEPQTPDPSQKQANHFYAQWHRNDRKQKPPETKAMALSAVCALSALNYSIAQ